MLLEINNLKKSFGTGESRVEVLKGIQFSVKKGEICVLLGPSGSGKSYCDGHSIGQAVGYTENSGEIPGCPFCLETGNDGS